MRIDIHNHTTRCNHAEGTVDEYIQKAIELGIDIYGFSEHAPMDFDPYYRLTFEEMQAYTDDIMKAKENDTVWNGKNSARIWSNLVQICKSSIRSGEFQRDKRNI